MRGDVVLDDLPLSFGAGAKVRRALVVQPRLTNMIVAMITSRIDKSEVEPTQFLIQKASPLGLRSGLLHDSAVKCENLFTVEQVLIRRVIGRGSAEAMNWIDGCLKGFSRPPMMPQADA
jgi:mRNA-degrading endonuclease toxin of MazEF toxin-antitoxin module